MLASHMIRKWKCGRICEEFKYENNDYIKYYESGAHRSLYIMNYDVKNNEIIITFRGNL